MRFMISPVLLNIEAALLRRRFVPTGSELPPENTPTVSEPEMLSTSALLLSSLVDGNIERMPGYAALPDVCDSAFFRCSN